jgi:hypothetical protein
MNPSKDEFGRDLKLRVVFPGLNKYKNMSWFDIDAQLEDEEIAKRTQENQKKYKAQMEERSKLYQRGLYELEDGEILGEP